MRDLNFVRWILLGTLCLSPCRGLRAQVITNFSPRYGAAGDQIKLYGSGFLVAPIEVNFWNGIPVTAPYANADGIATVTVPSGITTGPVSVRYSGGSWHYSPAPFTKVGTGPFITEVTPSYGSYGMSATIKGVHLRDHSAVTFAGIAAYSIGAGNPEGTAINNVLVPSLASGTATGPVAVTTPLGTTNSPSTFTVVGPGPYVAHFTPTAGSDTTPVTLNGLNFAYPNAVYFNGQNAGSSYPSSYQEMEVTAPVGVTTGPITVTTSAGSYTTTTLFYGPISLDGFSPSSGPTGTQVVITGKNLTNATSVKFLKLDDFSGADALFEVNNNNQITATVPDDAPTGVIWVATPWGSLFTGSSFVVTPTITGFTPPKGRAGITSVQINGTRLVDNSGAKPTVKFNGTNASTISSWSAHQVVALAPASSSGYITLTTADGTATSSNRFYYPPQISGFTPNTNPPGTLVTITGQSLIDASSVLFNNSPSTNFTVLGNTSIEAKVPADVTTGPITVTTPGGTTNSTALYYAVPVITAFAPSSGGPGTTVTVFGTSFQGTTSVKFNGTNASFSDVTPNKLKAVVPAGASTGPITVTAPAGTATSVESFVVPQVADVRVNTFNHTPNPVAVGGDLTLTLVVANYGPNTATEVTAYISLAPGQEVKSTAPLPSGVTVNTNGNPVVFNLGSILGTAEVPGYSQVSLVLTAQLPGLATNTVSVSGSTFDPNTGDNTATVVTTVVAASSANLNIAPVGSNQVRVAWPSTLAGYVLQSALGLTNSASWADVGTQPVTEGDEKVVTEPSTGAAKYYRLKK